MKKFSKILLIICIVFGFAGTTMAATSPNLGSLSTYGVVSETLTNAEPTSINGTIGLPVACATTRTVPIPGTIIGTTFTPCAGQLGIDQSTALADINGQALLVTCTNLGAGAVNLNAITIGANPPGHFPPGCYTNGGAMNITAGTSITLDGVGTYIFKPGGALTTEANASVLLNGASECDVFRAPLGGTTFGANTTFVGNIFRGDAAGLSITLGNNSTLLGRMLAFGSTVTTDENIITVPICPVPAGTGTLRVIKNVINLGGGTAVASDFIISVHTSTGVFVGSGLGLGTPGATYLLSSGTYTVTEHINTSYATTFSLLLGNCLNFAISSGDDKTCTVLNTYIIPTPSGGGAGGSLLIDDCPDGDYSTSYYDGTCGLLPAAATQSIHIVKVANRLTPFPDGGGDVVYTYAVTNVGNTPISDVVVTDDKCGPVTVIGGDVNYDNLLDTNEVWTYTCSTNISVTTRNIATVVGKANGVTITDTDFANVVVGPIVPETSFVPKFPNTGLMGVSLGKLAILGSIFLIFSVSFVVALRKRDR